MTASSPIPVVCALLKKNGRLLIAQRPAHKHLPNKWEFPGGKVEAGEAAAAAIIREIQEELGCQITELQPLPTFLHDYQTVIIKMIPFVCVLRPGSPAPQPHEHQALAWVTPMELRSYDLAAADWPALASYEQMI